MESEGLLLPGALPTPPEPARAQDLNQVHLTALSSEASLSKVVIGNSSEWPGNGGTIPNENSFFTTRVDPVSPP